jgi:hypothetical protein
MCPLCTSKVKEGGLTARQKVHHACCSPKYVANARGEQHELRSVGRLQDCLSKIASVYRTGAAEVEPFRLTIATTVENMLVQLEVEPSSNAGGWGDHFARAWHIIRFLQCLWFAFCLWSISYHECVPPFYCQC